MATSIAAIALIFAPRARSTETFPPCASAWKTALRLKVAFRFAAKASRTRPRLRNLPKLLRLWRLRPAHSWRKDYRVTDQGHACACPVLLSFDGAAEIS